MTPEQAEEQVRKDASDRMQHNTTADLSARLMCRVGFRELTLLLAHYDGLKRAHAASLAPAVPEGWVMVPLTATREMLKAAGDYADQCAVQNYGGSPDAEGIWDAMIDARPLPTEGEATNG